MSTTDYSTTFYTDQQEGSRRSAAVVVPMVLELLGGVTSVLDVGCGVGAWLAEFARNGVTDIVGVDGDYVDRGVLQIPANAFLPVDLGKPFDLHRRFDLVISVEVAEHLDQTRGTTFVQDLSRHADAILFSAAVSGQGGQHHVNEQWPSYWVPRFERVGFTLFDVVRPMIWDLDGLESWYQQNLLIFGRDQPAHRLGLEASRRPVMSVLDVVHPREFARKVEEMQTLAERRVDRRLGPLLRALPAVGLDALRWRWKRRASSHVSLSSLSIQRRSGR